ncbi:hypothetical protein L873DRAFT_1332880 [Choiromyces venosus 120613-1]|uniref:Uncharacterized protein n=1 Tax=Choiromyces venosus 120613-1 TaxID=1336337 RepID=A0A3N4JMY2_9PEZI|nr:hypothetical protein L873DRAFT_1332880 [Choiromyces venosus 120613-1]
MQEGKGEKNRHLVGWEYAPCRLRTVNVDDRFSFYFVFVLILMDGWMLLLLAGIVFGSLSCVMLYTYFSTTNFATRANNHHCIHFYSFPSF